MKPYWFCSENFRAEPFWWDRTPRLPLESRKLPLETDVLVIGSGYTGLHCALQTARAGRATLVIDAGDAGQGCSTRNGGQISGEIKPDFATLRDRYGAEQAAAMLTESRQALGWLGDFVERENIDCDYHRCGRFIAAHSRRQYEKLVARARYQVPGLEVPMRVVAPFDKAEEIDSPFYHGGLVVEHHCALDPARYHQGLLDIAQREGAQVVDHCRATRVTRRGEVFSVETDRGRIEARDLVVATNGYTENVTPWQRRRVIPIGSYMLATEPLDPAMARQLMPKQRVFSDTRRVVVYFRLCPEGRRLLFGGRVSVFESDPLKSLPALRLEMLRIFPQLDQAPISHTWMGFVAYTFDNLPHLGVEDRIHYAMGYCGSGICLASHFGHLLGRRLAGETVASAFDRPAFESRPLYNGRPWFLASAVRYYQFLDSLS